MSVGVSDGVNVEAWLESAKDNFAINCLTGPIGFALFIIGCLAVAGTGNLTAVTGGGAIVGLSVSLIVLHVVNAIRSGHGATTALTSYSAIMTIVSTIIGALAISGHVSLYAAGWTVIGPTIAMLVATPIICCLGICCCGSALNSRGRL